MSPRTISEYVEGLPNISGSEDLVNEAMARTGPFYLQESGIDFGRIRSAFSIALHMHQPLIPAGGGDLRTAAVISNLKYMMDNPGIGDNHNASVFHWCYKRMGEFIPQLTAEGKNPRVMLDYSGTLLHGLRAMGLDDVFDNLKRITLDPAYRRSVEWLGTAWGHAVAPSTPAQDFRLHVRAWQHHFAAIFGFDALSRVRGFSPPEMALPNHPDVAYEFVRRPEGLRVPLGAGTGAFGGEPRRQRDPAAARSAPAGCPEFARRDAIDRRHRQDAGERHQAGRDRCSRTTRRRGFRAWTSAANRCRRW